MTSDLKSATSRANGAKSHGPKTAEGREKSSQNSLNHGFTAKKTVLLACENPAQFQEMLGDYAATYHPGSPIEEGLVNEMVACRWRMQRLRMIETALMDIEMQRELPEAENPDDPGYRMAFAFRRLVDGSRAISLASRYESRLHRIHEQSHRTLRELQNNPSVSAGAPEPTPAPAPESSVSDEKSRNEPTPPATKDHQPISIVRHSSLKSWGGRSCRLPRRVTA